MIDKSITLYTYTVVVVATDIREVNERLSHVDTKTDLGKIHKKVSRGKSRFGLAKTASVRTLPRLFWCDPYCDV